jgi:hypothetical protein
MSTQIPTLRDLFVTSHAGRREGRALPPPPAALATIVAGFQWDGIYDKALDLLDISVLDVMLGAWKTRGDFRKHVRASAADPTKTLVVPLGTHRIASEHRPSIEVRSEGRLLAKLHFPVEVAFEVEAAQLTLRGGTVTEIRTGELKARGTVKFEHTVILERDLEPIHFPGKIVLSDAALKSDARHVTSGAVPQALEVRAPIEGYVLLK